MSACAHPQDGATAPHQSGDREQGRREGEPLAPGIPAVLGPQPRTQNSKGHAVTCCQTPHERLSTPQEEVPGTLHHKHTGGTGGPSAQPGRDPKTRAATRGQTSILCAAWVSSGSPAPVEGPPHGFPARRSWRTWAPQASKDSAARDLPQDGGGRPRPHQRASWVWGQPGLCQSGGKCPSEKMW